MGLDGHEDSWPRGGKKVNAAGHRQDKREATIIAHGSLEVCQATPIGLADESKESLYVRETNRDLRCA